MSLTSSEADDNGFPILRRDINDDGMRMVGYIGSNELEHALSALHFPSPFLSPCSNKSYRLDVK